MQLAAGCQTKHTAIHLPIIVLLSPKSPYSIPLPNLSVRLMNSLKLETEVGHQLTVREVTTLALKPILKKWPESVIKAH